MPNFLPEPGDILIWRDKLIANESKEACKRRSGRLIYTIWNIWKRGNKRVFTGRRMTHREVAMLAYEAIKQCQMAFSSAVPAVSIS